MISSSLPRERGSYNQLVGDFSVAQLEPDVPTDDSLSSKASVCFLVRVSDLVNPASCAAGSDYLSDRSRELNDPAIRSEVCKDDYLVPNLEAHGPFLSVGTVPDILKISSSA
jgi:hypothetical protein